MMTPDEFCRRFLKMSQEDAFERMVRFSKPLAWMLVAVLISVFYRIAANGIPDDAKYTLLFVGASCLLLIPIMFKFGAYAPVFTPKTRF